MKPSFEELELSIAKKSFNFFKVDVECFQPFWHYHPELELTLITKGQGVRFVGDSILPFFDFDLVLVGENVPHHWVSQEEKGGRKQQAYVFQFPTSIFYGIVECSPLLHLFKKADRGIQFKNPSKEIIQLIKSFCDLNKLQQIGALMHILNLLQIDEQQELLSSVHYKTTSLSNSTQSKINETISFILNNLDQKLTVNRLADQTAMVPQSFCRWFKKATGNSFVTFLNMARIEKACQLLLTSQMSIQQIAFECGFESLSHFNRTFKMIKEKSPSAFKKTLANQ